MATRATRVLEAALELPARQRGQLITDLINSLDGPPDTRTDAEWDAEIHRRAEEVRSGRVKTIPWATVKRTIRASLKKKR